MLRVGFSGGPSLADGHILAAPSHKTWGESSCWARLALVCLCPNLLLRRHRQTGLGPSLTDSFKPNYLHIHSYWGIWGLGFQHTNSRGTQLSPKCLSGNLYISLWCCLFLLDLSSLNKGWHFLFFKYFRCCGQSVVFVTSPLPPFSFSCSPISHCSK